VAPMLIVEDNPVNQKLLATILGKQGHEVDVADNGADALEMCSDQRYDMIWMDLMMPVMDGYETIARIRDGEAGHHPVIVTLTADSVIDARERAYAAGCDDFLTKPYTKDAIVELIAKHL